MSNFQNTFILGVGAQKSGTTWVSAYLNKSAAYQRGLRKEYHVWDVLHIPGVRPQEKAWLKNYRSGDSISDRRLGMLVDNSDYFEYFDSLFQNPGKTIAADITPEYAGLKSNELQYIKSQFELRGIKTKVVFLMRDPYERCWSTIRMSAKYMEERTGRPPKADDNFRLLSQYM